MSTTSEVQITNTKKKISVSETGHAKIIANFQDLISFCHGYGTSYNPAKDTLKIIELQNKYQSTLEKFNQAKTNKVSFDNAKNNRRLEFENLKPFTTKIINAFSVSGADDFAISDLKSVNKKIQGSVTKKAKKNDEDASETVKTISTSQQSYDRLIDHFANLIQVLEQNTLYNPNENELKLASIQTKMQSMQRSNTNLINAYTLYSNAIIQRNLELYDSLTGLTRIAKEVKLYVKSVFGATSTQYNQISGLEFKTIKK